MHFSHLRKGGKLEYYTIKELAEKWGITTRRIQKMCSEGLISGAVKFGRDWAIPKDTIKPADKRFTTGNYVKAEKEQNI